MYIKEGIYCKCLIYFYTYNHELDEAECRHLPLPHVQSVKINVEQQFATGVSIYIIERIVI